TQAVLVEPASSMTEQTGRIRLVLSPQLDSLLHLWTQIGYEYNLKRSGQAALAVQYLRCKQKHLAEREGLIADIRSWKDEGVRRCEIIRRVAGQANQRFVE